MPSPSSLKSSAPSASLLRFLRSQSESLFFTNNPTACGQTRPPLRLPSLRNLTNNCNRVETPPSQEPLQASLLPLPSFSARGRGGARCRTSFTPPLATPAFHVTNAQPSRAVSTKDRPLFRRLLDWRRSKAAESNKYACSPPTLIGDGTEPGFTLGRGLAAKATNEPRLRCTEFDSNGNVTLVNGEFKKSELIAKYGLLPRDLRKIDSSTLPHILVRPSAILINLLHLRVLIKADRVLVFDAYGSTDSYMQSLFVYDLEGKLRQRQGQSAGALPYEFRALEAVLISVTSGLEEEFNGVREPVVRVLRALEEDIDREKLRHLLIYSKKLGTFEQKARLVRDAIDDLLEADDDLAAMYLTERQKNIEREEDDHQEVEMLLESYHKVCDEIVQASGNLVTGIRNTEEVVKAILDANRNSLMLLDLKFSIGTLGLATGTLFSALYGMNLKNFIEESDLGFGAVSVTCFAITLVVCVYGLAKLRKLQRVRMWGEDGAGGSPMVHLPTRSGAIGHRPNWRADSIDPVWGSLPGEARSERLKRIRDSSVAAAVRSAAAQRASSAPTANPTSKAEAREPKEA
ncbi:cora-domain-containing protein [Aspergillus uvarum CBS 121591]|uniref:Magnesium transporter n=1 Tax=Aspergillus uvarum CBS 121591 TaxID=1448315 RepID=A0A319C757_9EURO|nr:cora-domain-containing protein [Aspergillus uvarum CBS 121591]PYH79870.1 cora-domain-containing protein [Aspergillus uvarum CBS 121591]